MHILIVEDEAVLRESLVDGLSLAIRGSVCRGSDSVEGAQAWMTPPPDVIISDVRLPGRSGIDFLLETRRQSPTTRFILMTAFGETISEEQALAQGAIRFLNKPFALKDLVKYVNECKPGEGLSGLLQGVSLVDLMQVLVMGKRSMQIDVETQHGTGQIVLVKGEAVFSQIGNTKGEQAFFALVTQASGRFSTRTDFPIPETNLNTPFHFLVMEAMRLLDEGQLIEIEPAAAPPAPPEKVDSSPASRPRIDLAALEEVEGFVSACVVNAADGKCICRSGATDASLLERVYDEAKALQRMAESLKVEGAIEDVMFTLEKQCHLIRPIGGGSAYLHVVLNRTKSNLGVARHIARTIDQNLRS